MGEYISMGDALIVSLFSITMIFVVLIIISVFISLLKNLGPKETELVKKTDAVTKAKDDKAETKENINDEELIAVISAAVAASLGVAIPEINIRKISRVSGSSTAWSNAGRQEQISGKL